MKMKKKIIIFCLSVATLILEILPYGAVLSFANPEGEPWRHTYSYFDLTPFGYAVFGPLITAVFSCALLVLCVIFLFKSTKPVSMGIKVLSGAAALISLTPLLYGLEFFSAVGGFISALLVSVFLLSVFSKNNS